MTELNSPNNKTSLTEFVARNDKVLAAIGVFVALSAFFISLPLKSLSSVLAFASLVATLPLIYEFAKDLLRTKPSWSLVVFSNVFTLFIGYFIWYVLIAFRDQWWSQMHKVVFWSIFLGLLGLYRKFFRNQYQRLFGYVGFHGERWITFFLSHAVSIQFALWTQLQFLQQAYVFGRYKPSAWRQKVIHLRVAKTMRRDLSSKYEEARTKRWRAPEPSNDLKIIGTILLFIPIFIGVGQLERPIADMINIALDIQAEEYQQEEKSPKRRLDVEVIGAPNQTPTPTETPVQ